MNKLLGLLFAITAFTLCSCLNSQKTKFERTKTHKTDCPFFNREKDNLEDECLQSSVRVNKRKTGTSSGTIIKSQIVDKNKTEIIVLSTGHMRDRVDPEIEIFYLNGKRLVKPLIVKCEIFFLVENGPNKGVDFSLLKGTANCVGIAHKPLAPNDYTIENKSELYSCGCDLGVEPKFFKVTAHKTEKFDVYTKEEAGVGRSGGGLFTVDGKYVVGVCWGGEQNHTRFTTHKTIHKLAENAGLEEELKCEN